MGRPQILYQDVVVTLNPGASIDIPISLGDPFCAFAPQQVYPDRATAIRCTAATTTTASFTNPGVAPESVTFRCQLFHSIETSPPTIGQLLWQGLGGSVGGAETLQQAYNAGASAADSLIVTDVVRMGVGVRYTPGITAEKAFYVNNAANTIIFFAVYGSPVQNAAAAVNIVASMNFGQAQGDGALGAIPATFTINTAPHLNLATLTEYTSVLVNMSQTRTWVAGNFALQRAMRITGEEIAFTGNSFLDDAVTLYVEPPSAGVNANIDRLWTGWFNGNVRVGTGPGPGGGAPVPADFWITGSTFVRGQVTCSSNAATASWVVQNNTLDRAAFASYGSAAAGDHWGSGPMVALAGSVTLVNIDTNGGLIINSLQGGIFLGTNEAHIQIQDAAGAAKTTQIYVNENGTLKQVTIGIDNSGGVGFSLLRVAN